MASRDKLPSRSLRQLCMNVDTERDFIKAVNTPAHVQEQGVTKMSRSKTGLRW